MFVKVLLQCVLTPFFALRVDLGADLSSWLRGGRAHHDGYGGAASPGRGTNAGLSCAASAATCDKIVGDEAQSKRGAKTH